MQKRTGKRKREKRKCRFCNKAGCKWIILLVFSIVLKNHSCYWIYAGEFGGFDIDIGTDEDIFANWEEEPKPEVPSEPIVPEERGNEGGNENSGAESSAGSSGAESNSTGSSSGGSSNIGSNSGGSSSIGSNSGGSSGTGSNSGGISSTGSSSAGSSTESSVTGNSGGGSSNTGSSVAGKNSAGSSNTGSSVTGSNSVESNSTGNGSAWNNVGNNGAGNDSAGNSGARNNHAGENQLNSVREKKVNEKTNSKITALGTAFTAVGQAKISPEFKFYNNVDGNKEKDKNINEHYNINVRFRHAKKTSVNELPIIQLVGMVDIPDITILSLRLNGEEVLWHQERNKIIVDHPITEKKNSIELVALIEGRQIIKMPVWKF